MLRKGAAGPAPVRFHKRGEGEHKPAALVAVVRKPAAHCSAAEPGQARFHRLVERYRQAAVVRPVLSSKGPAEGRRVPSGRRRAHWGLDRLVLLSL